MQTIDVQSVRGAYPIRFAELDTIAQAIGGRQAVIITDANVDRAWGAALPDRWPKIVLSPGEATKSPNVYVETLQAIAATGLKRDGALIALGGGVVGDLVGFVAATYMRGVDYVQVPTTLMAMVDSAIGGKTGIDLPEGKNLVGAFHPPLEVLIDVKTLETLPKREYVNGLAECVKYGCIADPNLFQLIQAEAPIEEIVYRCAAIKAQIVSDDEFETKGLRAQLNFGHTIGHAIEAELGYATLLHGEAVAIGMILETLLAESLGIAPRGLHSELGSTLDQLGLPTDVPKACDPDALVARMRLDKKATQAGLAFSLPTRWGECKLVRGVSENSALAVLRSHE